LTGHAARDAIANMSQRFNSEEWNLMCRPVLRKDLRAGISDKTINKICKKTVYEVPVFGCQLATNSEGRPEMSGKKRLEPKLDGSRMLLYVTINQGVTSAVSYSRNGKIYENFSKIEDQAVHTSSRFLAEPELKNGYVLDGEVMAGSFQELMTQARRKSEVDTDNIVFHVFDIIPVDEFNEGLWNKPLKDRIKLMEKLKPVFNSMNNFKMLESIEVDLDTAAGIDQYNRYCNDKVNEGYEGVMIKDMDAPYECTRTLKWLKYKPVYEYDLVATEVVEGTGRNKGRMGAIMFKGTDDASGKYIEVSVGSGWSDEDRDYFYKNPDKALDRTGEILADAITQNADGSYSLRFPRMNKWRDDK
jgi:DNA ligase-1